MTKTLWRKRTPCDGMMSWFDHEFIANDCDTDVHSEPDIKEIKGSYVIKATIPGLKKKDIHLELSNGTLTLRGERHEKNAGSYKRYRRTIESFEQKFKVPKGISINDIYTKYADGVLELTIPVPKSKKAKDIEVKAA